MTKRVLIMGGTGVFGKRLARHLVTFPDIEIIVTSRSAEKAEHFAKRLHAETPNTCVQGIALDHGTDFAARLEMIKPFAVIDCSGPFQTANYDAARTIIQSGAHLIDLADARDYLAGFSDHLDTHARDTGVCALTGASSTPTLSTCVVEHLTRGWRRVDAIDICITPGGKSEVGRSVIEAILSYAGKDIPSFRNGKLAAITGWTSARKIHIPRLGPRRVAAVETYDAEYLASRFDVTTRVSFSAGLESQIEQRGIEMIAALRKHHLFPNPQALIPLLLRARRITRIPTSDQGGMLVEVTGLNTKGKFTTARWSLVARNDHGPFIPILPAAAALQNLLEGDAPVGAVLAHTKTTLEQVLAQMAAYEITTETRTAPVDHGAIEANLGRASYRALPEQVQAFHSQSASPIWFGRADIQSGKSLFARFLARVFGFPATGKDVPLTIVVERGISADGMPAERWTRNFAGKEMTSTLRHSQEGRFSESFPPFEFEITLTGDPSGLKLPVSGWRLGGLPLPRFLAPRSEAHEYQDDAGRFCFDVCLTAPIIGLLAHYRGWLKPQQRGE